MKITKEQKEKLREIGGDWENYHGEVDDMLRKRLKELDPEFIKSLDKETKGATFWYA